MVAPNRDEKPIPAVGQLWAGKFWGVPGTYDVTGICGEHCMMKGSDGAAFQVTAEALAGPDWQCVGLVLPGGRRAMVGDMWVCPAKSGGPFRLDAVVQTPRGAAFAVTHFGGSSGDDGVPSYVGDAFLSERCVREGAAATMVPMRHVHYINGATVVADVTPDAAGRYKINVTAASGVNVAGKATAAGEAAHIFASALRNANRRDWSRADDTKEGKVSVFASAMRNASPSRRHPLSANLAPLAYVATLRRFADRLSGPFAGLSAAGRRTCTASCKDAAQAISAMVEPSAATVAAGTDMIGLARFAVGHAEGIIASLAVLDVAGSCDDEAALVHDVERRVSLIRGEVQVALGKVGDW